MVSKLNRLGWFLSFSLGSVWMYFADRHRGASRRAMVRDQFFHSLNRSRRWVNVGIRDLSHRSVGIAATARRRFQVHPVSDEVLIARVRTKLGRIVSHPHAIEVGCSDGIVSLKGYILQKEVNSLVSNVKRVAGVKDLKADLSVHEKADHISSLQGGRPRLLGRPLDLFQKNWSPATRLLVSLSGTALVGLGFSKRKALSEVMKESQDKAKAA